MSSAMVIDNSENPEQNAHSTENSEPPNLSAKADELANKELTFKIKKLRKECKNLDYQISKKYRRQEYLKAIAGLGGVIAAFATLATIMFSVIKWKDDSKISQEIRREESLDNALERLGDPSPKKRIGE